MATPARSTWRARFRPAFADPRAARAAQHDERTMNALLGVAHDAPARIARDVLLHAEGEATLLTLTHERFFDEATRNSHHQGWTSALDLLAALFD